MSATAIRSVFEQFVNPKDSHEQRRGKAIEYVENFRKGLGLSVNRDGRPVREAGSPRPASFSIRELAVGIVGEDWVNGLVRDTGESYRVFEAGGNALMTPGNLPNVSAFLGSVSGLLDAAVLETYDDPEFVIDALVPVESTKTRQTKMIGTGRIGNQSQIRNPGDAHPWAQFEERYSTSPETQQDALAIGVTYEAVFYDQTGEVLAKANSLGKELGLRKEFDGMQVIAGVTNPYNYRGASYNTYLTSGNWINDQSNQLDDWTDVNNSRELFTRMKDQETSNRIAVEPDTILVSPQKRMTASYIMNATEIESRTASAAEVRRGANEGPQYKLMSSVYMDQVLTNAAADPKVAGLGLSQANANQYWWHLKTTPGSSAFVRYENWPIDIRRASPSDFEMLNRRMVLAVFANQSHAFMVREPRYVVRNKN